MFAGLCDRWRPGGRRRLAVVAMAGACWFAVFSTRAQVLPPPLRVSDLQQATAAVIESGSWSQHLDYLDRTAVDALRRLPPVPGAGPYRAVVDDPVTGWAVAQAALIRIVTPSTLARASARAGMNPFLQWLLRNRPALEDFCETIQPANDAAAVLEIWARLWVADPAGREKYYRLALACGVVFDRPVPLRTRPGAYGAGTVDVLERYRYYRDAAERGQLRVSPSELSPGELIWVVDAPVPTSELVWARQHVGYSRFQWAKAYDAVPYALGVSYDEYTLAEIRRKGGACGDRAWFAATTAKANGIPAMAIVGEGQRGGHAWFGYLQNPGQWNLNAGRYADDRYVTGTATDPQTGAAVREQELELLTDPQRRSANHRLASRLLWLAQAVAARGDPVKVDPILRTAVEISPRHFPAWTARIDLWKATGAPRARWDELFQAMRAAYRPYPDRLARINALETEMIRSRESPAEAAEAVARQYRRLQGDSGARTDLLVDSVGQQAALWEQDGNLEAAEKTYQRALREKGREIVAFRQLANAYAGFGERHDRRRSTIEFIYSQFRQFHEQPPRDDCFALTNVAGLDRWMADRLDQDGQGARADSLRKQADRLQQRADRLCQALSKNPRRTPPTRPE